MAPSIVAVQIQSGTAPVTGANLIGGHDTRVRIGNELYGLGERVNHFASADPSSTRPKRLRELKLRVGTVEGTRDPIWAAFHGLFHGGTNGSFTNEKRRPNWIPVDGKVRWVHVDRTLRGYTPAGPRWRWEVRFVVAQPMAIPHAPTHRSAGVDIGWRRVPGGIRVAYAALSDGTARELVLPDDVLDKTVHDKLRATRDNSRNKFRDALIAFREALPRDAPLRIKTEHTHAWLRIGRFVSLANWWADNRTPGDEPVYEQLQAWLKQDRHLGAWAIGQHDRQRCRVKGRQQQWIAALLADVDTVVVERTIRIDRMKAKATADDEGARRAAVANVAAAPGRFRVLVIQATRRRGLQLTEVSPAWTTQKCSHCGALRELEDQRPLILTCLACGVSEDQDLTAARNLLASATTPAQDGTPLAGVSTENRRKLAPRRTRRAAKPTPGSQPLADDASTT